MRYGKLNPEYRKLQSFVESLPKEFESSGETIYAERNILKRYRVEGVSVIVKRYRVPIFVNRIAYAYVRRSKAKRAYYNALEVVKRGYETPHSIAYLEERGGGVLGYSYFVSTEAVSTDQVRLINYEPKENEDLLEALGGYVGALQNSGICHEDLSPGNILYRKDSEGRFHFELCDINRMSFRTMSAREGVKNLERLLYNREAIVPFARIYCRVRGLDYESTVEAIDRVCRLFWLPKWKRLISR